MHSEPGLEVLRADDPGEYRVVEAGVCPADAGEVDAVLRPEVLVDDRPAHARGAGDQLDRRAGVARLGEQVLGHVEQLGDPLVAWQAPAPGCPG